MRVKIRARRWGNFHPDVLSAPWETDYQEYPLLQRGRVHRHTVSTHWCRTTLTNCWASGDNLVCKWRSSFRILGNWVRDIWANIIVSWVVLVVSLFAKTLIAHLVKKQYNITGSIKIYFYDILDPSNSILVVQPLWSKADISGKKIKICLFNYLFNSFFRKWPFQSVFAFEQYQWIMITQLG